MSGRMSLRWVFVALVACAVPASLPAQQTRTAPPQVTAAAVTLVRERVGTRIYERWVTFLPELTRYQPAEPLCGNEPIVCHWPWRIDQYVLFFRFDPVRDSARTGLIVVPLDTLGRSVPDAPMTGAPECAAAPATCTFTVDRDSALALARAAGLPAGIRPWIPQFVWMGWPAVADCQPCWGRYDLFASTLPREAYAWKIVSVTADGEGWASGTSLWLDANSGDVLDRREWSAVQ